MASGSGWAPIHDRDSRELPNPHLSVGSLGGGAHAATKKGTDALQKDAAAANAAKRCCSESLLVTDHHGPALPISCRTPWRRAAHLPVNFVLRHGATSLRRFFHATVFLLWPKKLAEFLFLLFHLLSITALQCSR